jgi:hypothetical protein
MTFFFLSLLNITFGAVGAGTGAGAASCHGSISTNMMRLLAAPAPADNTDNIDALKCSSKRYLTD